MPRLDADEPNQCRNEVDDLDYDVGLICSRDSGNKPESGQVDLGLF